MKKCSLTYRLVSNRAIQRNKLGLRDLAIDDCDNAVAISDRLTRRLGQSIMRFQQVDLWAQATVLAARLKMERGDPIEELADDVDRVVDRLSELSKNTKILTLHYRAKIAVKMEHFAIAERTLDELLTLRPDLSEDEIVTAEHERCGVLWNGARAYEEAGEHKKAIEKYSRFIDLVRDDPTDLARALVNRSAIYLRQQTFDLCDQDCSSVLALTNAPVDQLQRAWLNRSMCRLLAGDRLSAEKDLAELADVVDASDPLAISMGYIRALCLRAAGNAHEARRILETIVMNEEADATVKAAAKRIMEADEDT